MVHKPLHRPVIDIVHHTSVVQPFSILLVHEPLWVPVLTSKLLSVQAFAGVYMLGILVSPAWTWLLCVKIVTAVEHRSERLFPSYSGWLHRPPAGKP